MKKIILSLAAGLFSITSFAQWSTQNSGTTNSFTSIAFSGANYGLATTVGNEIFASTDGGVNWTLKTTAGNSLYSICYGGPSSAFACGAAGSFLTSLDAGNTWTPHSTGQGNNLYSVYFFNADTGIVVGANGTILKTMDAGVTWTPKTSGTANGLNSVYFTDLNNGYAVGDLGTILNTTNGGNTWTTQTSGSGANLYGTYFVSSTYGFAVGQGGNILKTNDGGTTWVSTASGTSNTLYSVRFYDFAHGFAVGAIGTVVKTNDAGGYWYTQTAGVTSNDIKSICSTDVITWITASVGGTIQKTYDGGCSTPVVTIGGPAAICAGTTTTLTATGAQNYQWDANGGNSITNITTITPGSNIVVSVYGTSSDGCIDTGSTTIIVRPLPFITTTPNDITCNGACNGVISAIASGNSPFTYAWSNGATTQTTTNLCPGNYSVTVTDSYGCSDSVWGPITEPPALVAGATTTPASCIGVNDGTATNTSSGGSGAFNYLWMPGSITSPSPGSLAVGIYTLTVTDAQSCTATTTVSIGNQAGNVILTINAAAGACEGQPQQLTYTIMGGTSPFTNDWYDYGQGSSFCTLDTAILAPVISGIDSVRLTVTDNLGCIFTSYTTIAVGYGDSISGVVRDTANNLVTSGNVYLFMQKTSHVGLSDTVGIASIQPDGSYTFPNVFYGDYFIMVDADTSLAAYKTAIPTYYSNKTYPFQWDSALVLNHYTCGGGNQTGYDVKIIQLPGALTGPGQISGHISEGTGFGQRFGHGHNAPLGAPLKGVDIKLGKNPGGSPAARTTTDNNGDYVFNNIPIGDYKIYVNIPNYGMDSVLAISITSTSTVSANNDYYVDSLMVRVDTASGAGILTNTGTTSLLFVYPNPASSSVTLKAPKELGMITIINSLGQAVYKEMIRANQQRIDIANLPTGIYIIGAQNKFIRLVKE